LLQELEDAQEELDRRKKEFEMVEREI